MKKLFEKLNKLEYTFTNKRVLGNPDHTSPETREKDLIQEYALIVMWLLKNHGIFIELCFWKVDGVFKCKIGDTFCRYCYPTPLRAYEAAVEEVINNLITDKTE